jgi:hypothetical protein
VNSHSRGAYFHGYNVVGSRFILLSLIDSTFFCLDCAACSLTIVTDAGKSSKYMPISAKLVHLGDDDGMVYFIWHGKMVVY